MTFREGVDQIIKEFELSTRYPQAVVAESKELQKLSEQALRDRVDLRSETVFTIDGESARDFDDAVSISEGARGIARLKVSIADVGEYVTSGSALDREARNRATSVYFPDLCLPMFPERLSNDLCSLVPGESRLTFTAEMDFDEQGKRIDSRFYKSIIRSSARLTYTEVRKMLADRAPEVRRQYQALLPDLEKMAGLAERMRNRRIEKGSLDFDLPEPEIVLDLEEGGVEAILRAERNLAHRMIEEFMIAANEAVAEFLTAQGDRMLFRIHEEPLPEKLHEFELLLHNMGLGIHLKRRVRPADFVGILEKIKGRPEERVLNALLLRTMSRAVYSEKNKGHFGLASKCYTHFTSPIRRYPDLVVHRILANAVGPRAGHRGLALKQLAEHCSERERVAMKAEWACRDLAGAFFMKDHVGEEFTGVVSGVTEFGFFVEINPFFVEGLVRLKTLRDDYYIFRKKWSDVIGKRTKKRFRIGDSVRVVLEKVDLARRWIDLCPAKSVPNRASSSPP